MTDNLIDKDISAGELDQQFALLVAAKGIESAVDILANQVVEAVNKGKLWIVMKLLTAQCLGPGTVGDLTAYLRFRSRIKEEHEEKPHIIDSPHSVGAPLFGWMDLLQAEKLLAEKRVDEALLALRYPFDLDLLVKKVTGEKAFRLQVAILTARALTAAGRYDEAHCMLDIALQTGGENLSILYSEKGNTARAEGKHWLAVSSYLDAIEEDASIASPYLGLTFGLAKTAGLWERATKILERVCSGQHGKVPKPMFAALHRLYELQSAIDKATLLNRRYVNQTTREKLGKQFQIPAERYKKPRLDFLIIGASKCGTTSLFSWLGKHPRAMFPHTKEIGFFGTKRYAHGIEWYLSHFSPICDDGHFFTGEASPGYFGKTNLASQQIRQSLESVKIIILLRNPADRTLSTYYQLVKMGKMKRPLQEVIDGWILKYDTTGAHDLDETTPVAISVYAPRVRKWFDTFGKENCLILNADTLFANPISSMPEVFSFLGIDHTNMSYGVANAGTYRKGDEYDHLREKLLRFFEPSIRDLEKLIEQETNWLRKK
jgi:tetratricopeptide (TPR) repeat protein